MVWALCSADGPADASAPMVLTDLERKSLAGGARAVDDAY